MRDWCLVIDATSAEAADQIGLALRDRQLDLEVEGHRARVLCFAASEDAIRVLAAEIREILEAASLWQGTVRWGHLRAWNDREHRYVDPEHPDESLYGGDLDIDEIRWRVRVELTSVFESRHVRKALPSSDDGNVGGSAKAALGTTPRNPPTAHGALDLGHSFTRKRDALRRPRTDASCVCCGPFRERRKVHQNCDRSGDRW